MIRRPDFERLKRTLYCEKADAIPIAELFHDIEVMDYFMGKEVNSTKDHIEFYEKAGYDYFPIRCSHWFTGVRNQDNEIEDTKMAREWRKSRATYSQAETERKFISSLDEFKKYDWSYHARLRGGGDLSYLDYVASLLPAGMKIIAWSDGIYEFFTKNIGYERFCYALSDEPNFVETVFDEVGRRTVEAYVRIVTHPAVGAIWLADDLGYTEGLLWSPELMRKYLFPWYKDIGKAACKYDKPFIFHSDGKLWSIVPDLLDAGINAIQPIEPKAWNPVEVKRRYGHQLCIMGTIDIDLICRGTLEEVVETVKRHIDLLGREGGFVIGTSNTPAYYMNQENYRAMLRTAIEYGG